MAAIGFIGMGNMGYALMKGLLEDFDSDEILFSCLTEEKKKRVTEECEVRSVPSNGELAHACKYLILAVKPQVYEEVLNEISPYVHPDTVIFSLAPGKSTEYIKSILGSSIRVVRAMPNTPALIGCGMSGVAYDESEFDREEISFIDRLFSSVGKYKKVPEEAMSAVVCASGSSPAYVYMFIEALARSCEEKGLPYDTALALAAGAVSGAAEMVLKSGEDPEILKQRVCSKGGTTIAGISALEENGFSNAIREATQACYIRSEELGKQ